MSNEGDGMKLRDLARGSSNPTSFMPAVHILRSRFRNRETAKGSRKSYESVPGSSSGLHLLISLQQATLVHVLRILHLSRDPCSPVSFPIRTHYGDRNLHKRACHRPTSFSYFLIFEQNQSKAYHEVLIAGDLSVDDIEQTSSGPLTDDAITPDTAEFIYDNDTAYFVQPSRSQFVPDGHGTGTFTPPTIVLKAPPSDPLELTGRDAPKNGSGTVLRCAMSAH